MPILRAVADAVESKMSKGAKMSKMSWSRRCRGVEDGKEVEDGKGGNVISAVVQVMVRGESGRRMALLPAYFECNFADSGRFLRRSGSSCHAWCGLDSGDGQEYTSYVLSQMPWNRRCRRWQRCRRCRGVEDGKAARPPKGGMFWRFAPYYLRGLPVGCEGYPDCGSVSV